MSVRYGRLRMTRRELRLLRAANEALYWLRALDVDLEGNMLGESNTVEQLNDALNIYRKNGLHNLVERGDA